MKDKKKGNLKTICENRFLPKDGYSRLPQEVKS